MCAIMKSALMLSTAVQRLTPAALATVVNPEAIVLNKDALGVAGRRIASVPPRRQKLAAPFDALLALARCDPASPTQRWRLNATDSTLWTADATGARWCAGPSQRSWTRPIAVLPCDGPAYRAENAPTHEDCHAATCNYVAGFEAAPVACMPVAPAVASHCTGDRGDELGSVVAEACALRLKCAAAGGVITGIKFGLPTGDNTTCASYRPTAPGTPCAAAAGEGDGAAAAVVADLCVVCRNACCSRARKSSATRAAAPTSGWRCGPRAARPPTLRLRRTRPSSRCPRPRMPTR